MSFNVTGIAYWGWRASYSHDTEILSVNGDFIMKGCPWRFLEDYDDDIHLNDPGEFSHEPEDHVLGVQVAEVGDYSARLVELERGIGCSF